MKRLNQLCLLLALILALTGCGSSVVIGSGTAAVTLQARSPIPQDGILSAALLEQIRDENAIAVFEGTTGELDYEWTVFGSDITDPRDLDLRITAEPCEGGVQVSFSEKVSFGFPILLSVHLNEKWEADTAAAYKDGTVMYPVSLTGTKTTILNLSVKEPLGSLTILPEKIEEPHAPVSTEDAADDAQQNASDEYLSHTTVGQGTVYENTGAQTITKPIVQDDYLSASKNTQSQLLTGSKEQQGSTAQPTDTPAQNTASKEDSYLSAVQNGSGRVYSDGGGTEKDKYLTDPVPEGKPMPVEPEDQEINSAKTYTCTFSIECSTILNNLGMLDADKLEMVPSGGVILAAQTVTFYEGESVYDVLQRVCRENGIHMESSWTPIYNSAYVEGIHNLYEFDCGNLSGWMYRVNGWYPNYGCSRYQLAQGDRVEWRYTCDLGNDVGRKGTW